MTPLDPSADRQTDSRDPEVLDAHKRAVGQPHCAAQRVEPARLHGVRHDLAELVGELEDAGFRIRRIDGIARHVRRPRTMSRLRHVGRARRLIGLVERLPGGSPSTWMVAEVRA